MYISQSELIIVIAFSVLLPFLILGLYQFILYKRKEDFEIKISFSKNSNFHYILNRLIDDFEISDNKNLSSELFEEFSYFSHIW